jgi:hypothetical protein
MSFSWFVHTTDIRSLRARIAVVNTRLIPDDKLSGERRSVAGVARVAGGSSQKFYFLRSTALVVDRFHAVKTETRKSSIAADKELLIWLPCEWPSPNETVMRRYRVAERLRRPL